MGKNLATHPKQSFNRRSDALEMNQNLRDRSDGDRHKRVHKRIPGSVRYCAGCGAVSAQKRWITEPEAAMRVRTLAGEAVEETLCPGCARVRDGRVDGWVSLEGDVVREQGERLRSLVDHIVVGARRDDPVHRVISLDPEGDTMILQTTSQWLAETIGKAVHREFHGHLDIHFIPDEEFVRVYWRQQG